jgi:sRNA-binding protein
MARNRSASFAKRAREKAKQEKNREKLERRAQRRSDKDPALEAGAGEDPDIAGIVPGPQPPPEEAQEPRNADIDEEPTE